MEQTHNKTKIGYAVNEENQEELLKYCDHVIRAPGDDQNLASILNFVKENQEKNMFLVSLQNLNLQLVQLLPILELLEVSGNYFHIIEKNDLSDLSDQAYHKFFLKLAQNEKRTIVQRTQRGLKEAVENGIRIGRPQIAPEVAIRIKFLYQSKKYTIREVAAVCGVSLGTAYKYAFNRKEIEDEVIK